MSTLDRENDYRFRTERTNLLDTNFNESDSFLKEIIEILSPNVTKSLPPNWQEIETNKEALTWLQTRSQESYCLNIYLNEKKNCIGFVFLYEAETIANQVTLRFGYLIAEQHWGKGLGTEIVNGLIDMCTKKNNIISLSGGVATDNYGSVRVLEKCGFKILPDNNSTNELVFYTFTFSKNS